LAKKVILAAPIYPATLSCVGEREREREREKKRLVEQINESPNMCIPSIAMTLVVFGWRVDDKVDEW